MTVGAGVVVVVVPAAPAAAVVATPVFPPFPPALAVVVAVFCDDERLIGINEPAEGIVAQYLFSPSTVVSTSSAVTTLPLTDPKSLVVYCEQTWLSGTVGTTHNVALATVVERPAAIF
jgi:hypothetical protein